MPVPWESEKALGCRQDARWSSPLPRAVRRCGLGGSRSRTDYAAPPERVLWPSSTASQLKGHEGLGPCDGLRPIARAQALAGGRVQRRRIHHAGERIVRELDASARSGRELLDLLAQLRMPARAARLAADSHRTGSRGDVSRGPSPRTPRSATPGPVADQSHRVPRTRWMPPLPRSGDRARESSSASSRAGRRLGAVRATRHRRLRRIARLGRTGRDVPRERRNAADRGTGARLADGLRARRAVGRPDQQGDRSEPGVADDLAGYRRPRRSPKDAKRPCHQGL